MPPTNIGIPEDDVFSPADLESLRYARDLLENPGLAIKLTQAIGKPIEDGFKYLPKGFQSMVDSGLKKVLALALDGAMRTMREDSGKIPSNRLHKMAVAFSGGVGGFFGLPALSMELPVSTGIMLRSIAEIARSEGETLSNPETKLACLEVLALGGISDEDDAAETGYYAVRAIMARTVAEAAGQLAGKGSIFRGGPVVLRFVSRIASRFGLQVSEKFAAQALPIVGAAGGAAVNTVFLKHFQDMAKGHFIIRRLERTHGKAAVKAAYEHLRPSSMG